MSLDLHIATGSSVPIWEQITRGVRLQIFQGRLAAGDAMPSVRALAERLVVNPNTVVKAYGVLQRAGVLVTQPGRGVFVAERRDVFSKQERRHRLAEAATTLLHTGIEVGASADEIREALEAQLRSLRKSA